MVITWRILCVLALLALAGSPPVSAKKTLKGPIPAEVLKVIDGDTVDVRARIWLGQSIEIRVRLDKIDTPETKGKCALDAGNGARQNRDQPGFHFRLFHSATPEKETSFHYFYATANHYRLDEPEATDELFHENHITFLEDKEIMEVQQKRLEAAPTRPLEIIKSDEALVQARKALRKMIEEDQALSQNIAAE